MKRLASLCSIALVALAAACGNAVAAVAPTATTGGATAVGQTTATVHGTVNPHGSPTSFYFEFGTSTAYGVRTNTGNAGSGTTARDVSASLTGLRPNTTYHYRLVAFSPAGTSRGRDRTFKTKQVPTTSTISASPNPARYRSVVLVSGFLTGPGVGGQQVALEAKPFPYTGAFQQVGNTVVTTPEGGYSFVVPVFLNTQLRVVDKSKPSVTSPVLTEQVALSTSLGARRSHRDRHRVRFFGHVRPARVGNVVLIQRRTHTGGWKTVGRTLTRTKTGAFSGFARTLRLRVGGRFRAVVKTTGGDYVDGVTHTLKVSLR